MAAPAGGRGPVSPLGFAVLGSEMAGATVLGVVLDLWLGILPWLTVIGTFVGLLAVFVHMTQMTRSKPPGSGEGPQP